MKELQFISHKKAKLLEDSIGFLSNYSGPDDNEIHVVGNSLKEEDRNIQMTELLLELGKINKRRKEILDLFIS